MARGKDMIRHGVALKCYVKAVVVRRIRIKNM